MNLEEELRHLRDENDRLKQDKARRNEERLYDLEKAVKDVGDNVDACFNEIRVELSKKADAEDFSKMKKIVYTIEGGFAAILGWIGFTK